MPDQPSDAPAPPTRAAARARTAAQSPTGTDASSADLDVISALPAPGHRPAEPAETAAVAKPERTPRTDWRLGGRTVFRWREALLAIALVSLGLGVLAGVALGLVWSSPWANTLGTALVGLGMLVPIVVGFARSRPIGLLRLRALDLLYGVVLGGMLRLVQGFVAVANGNETLPTYPLVDGELGATWLLADGVGTALAAPLVEEFFFRGILLVALYAVLRRPLGVYAAGATTVLVTSGVFVLVHALAAPPTIDGVVGLGLLGLVCGLLVMLTGRIWAAVLVHVVYNTTFVMIALVGTFLA